MIQWPHHVDTPDDTKHRRRKTDHAALIGYKYFNENHCIPCSMDYFAEFPPAPLTPLYAGSTTLVCKACGETLTQR